MQSLDLSFFFDTCLCDCVCERSTASSRIFCTNGACLGEWKPNSDRGNRTAQAQRQIYWNGADICSVFFLKLKVRVYIYIYYIIITFLFSFRSLTFRHQHNQHNHINMTTTSNSSTTNNNNNNQQKAAALEIKIFQCKETIKEINLAMPMLLKCKRTAENNENEEEVEKFEKQIKFKNEQKRESEIKIQRYELQIAKLMQTVNS